MTTFCLSVFTQNAWAVNWIVPNDDAEINTSASFSGLEVSQGYEFKFKFDDRVTPTEDITLTIADNITLAGGSFSLNGKNNFKTILKQTVSGDTQGLLLKNGATMTMGELSSVSLASKLDLNSASKLTMAKGTDLSAGGDVFLRNGSALTMARQTKLSTGGNILLQNGSAFDLGVNTTLSAAGDILVDYSTITSANPTPNAMPPEYRAKISGKALTIQNGSSVSSDFSLTDDVAVSNSTIGNGEWVSTNGSALITNVSATDDWKLAVGEDIRIDNDLASNDFSGSFSAGRDLFVSSNMTGALSAGNQIQLMNGTYVLSGLSATNIQSPNNIDLTLNWGKGQGILDHKGALKMNNFKWLSGQILFSGAEKNATGAATGAGTLAMTWNNEIVGDLIVSDQVDMSISKSTTTDGWLKLHHFDISNSSLDIDSAFIESTVSGGSIKIGDNTSVSMRVIGLPDVDRYNYGHMIADTIDISSTGTLLNLTVDSGFLNEGETADYQLFEATSLTGDFAKIAQNARYVFTPLGNGLYRITATASGASASGSGLSGIGAAWLDSGVFAAETPSHEMNQHLNTLSQTVGMEDSFKNALSALSPTETPFVSTIAENNARQLFNTIDTRLERSEADQWHSSYRTTAQSSDSLWIQGIGSTGKYTGDKEFDVKSRGLVIGADTDPCDGCKFGVAYAYTKSDVDGFYRTVDATTHTGAVYADFAGESAYLTLMGSYAFSSFDEKKDVSGLNVDANYDVNVLAVQGVVGYDLGPVRMSRTLRTGSFIPEAGLRYLRVNQKSYTDSAEQSVSSASATTLTGLAGMHYTIDTKLGNNVVFYPDLKGMVTYDIVQDELSPTVRLSNNAMYQATEKRMDKLGAELGAELGLRFGRAVNLSLNYLGTLKKDYLDHTGTVRLKVSF